MKKATVKKIVIIITGTIILFVAIVIVNLFIAENRQSIVTKGQPIEKYSKHNKALLIVDIQEATTGDVSIYPFFKKNSDNLIRNINLMAENFHDQNEIVVYIRSEISNPLINLINDSYAKGSLGASFDNRLNKVSDLEIVKNGEDSFRNTALDSILTSNKISELYIVGLDAAECVNSTIEAAQNRKYSVNIIEEAVLSKSKETMDSMIMSFKHRGVAVIHIDSLDI